MKYTIRYTNPRCFDPFDRDNVQRLHIEANSAEQALENSGLLECDMEIVGVDEDNTEELQRDAAWLDSAVDAIPNWETNEGVRDFAEYIAAHPRQPFIPKENCQHDNPRNHAVLKGIFCLDCHQTIEPRNDFERRAVHLLTPYTSGYVHYR